MSTPDSDAVIDLPRFMPAPRPRDEHGVLPSTAWPTCVDCGALEDLDASTLRCRPCWRAWRRSPIGYLVQGARDEVSEAREKREVPRLEDRSGPGGASLEVSVVAPPPSKPYRGR